MIRAIYVAVILLLTINLQAQQGDRLVTGKTLLIHIYTQEGHVQRGVLAGYNDEELLIYPGASKRSSSQTRQPARIHYSNISVIKTKRPNGLLKGLLIGGGIGAAPALFGQGGGYAAIITFPAGIVTGSIVGAISKKKYSINGDITAFRAFTGKFFKKE